MIKTKKNKVAFISSYKPRVCGIASFTDNLLLAIEMTNKLETKVIALDRGVKLNYGSKVKYHFSDNGLICFKQMAEIINTDTEIDAVSLQHEFGLYGGDYGDDIFGFLDSIKKPLVTTMHMIPTEKESNDQIFKVTQHIGEKSDFVVALSEVGASNLVNVYGISQNKVRVIPHGVFVPKEFTQKEKEQIKNRYDLRGKKILTTLNIMRRSRGIDIVLEILPKLVSKYPNLVYLIVGRDAENDLEAKKYRDEIERKINDLKITKNVVFLNRYIKNSEVEEILGITDFFITPYRPPEESSSGSLAYAVAYGKVCISSPYNYAAELLSDNRGIIVPWSDSESINKALLDLMTNERKVLEMGQRSFEYGKKMWWPKVAEQYIDLFNKLK